MAGVIVILDVYKIDGVTDSGLLIEITDIARQIRVVNNALEVALEVPNIHRIKPNQCGEQPPIGLGNRAACEVSL